MSIKHHFHGCQKRRWYVLRLLSGAISSTWLYLFFFTIDDDDDDDDDDVFMSLAEARQTSQLKVTLPLNTSQLTSQTTFSILLQVRVHDLQV